MKKRKKIITLKRLQQNRYKKKCGKRELEKGKT